MRGTLRMTVTVGCRRGSSTAGFESAQNFHQTQMISKLTRFSAAIDFLSYAARLQQQLFFSSCWQLCCARRASSSLFPASLPSSALPRSHIPLSIHRNQREELKDPSFFCCHREYAHSACSHRNASAAEKKTSFFDFFFQSLVVP